MNNYDSTSDTMDHIEKVEGYLNRCVKNLKLRGYDHDASKLESPEKEIFDVVTPRLSALEYGSDEYRQALAEMKPALDHHYQANSHHPEHWPNGVDDMSLLDLIEMLCDWKAASERHTTGNIEDSLRINAKRFVIDGQLSRILTNTAIELGWIERK